MKNFTFNKFALAAGAVLALATSQAFAGPQFTFDPSGTGLKTGGLTVTGDQLGLNSTELIGFNADGSATAYGYAKTVINYGGEAQATGSRLYLEFMITTSTPTATATGLHYTVTGLTFNMYSALPGTTGFGAADSASGSFIPANPAGSSTGPYDQYGVNQTGAATLLLTGSIVSPDGSVDYANITGGTGVDLHSKENISYVNTNYFTAPSPFYAFAFDAFTNTPGTFFQASGSRFGAVNNNAGEADFSNVPEPGTVALFGIAAAALGLSSRRRKS